MKFEPTKNELFVVTFILFGLLFRWDIEAGSGTEGSSAMIHHKLDRWTGVSYVCSSGGCLKADR